MYKKEEEPKQKSKTEDFAEQIKKFSDLTEKSLKPEEYAKPDGWAESIAKEQKDKIKTAQLRKFFNKIKSLQRNKSDIKTIKLELIKLIPQLAFAKGRNVISKDFYDLLMACIWGNNTCRIKSKEEFDNFVSFLEAIVAYHKFHSKGE
ncbi:MAG: type III-A CRISPR-associated protein Csm2 [candidate division WOR-3 bacterium]